MASIVEMAEAHLLNVQREIQNLNQRKVEIDEELEKLSSYLNTGAEELNKAKSDADAELAG
jgi:predicted  nucleic acid-binding Zn-ribbon protein